MTRRGHEPKTKEAMRVAVGSYLECLELKEILLALIEKVEEAAIQKSFILIEEIPFITWRTSLIMTAVCQPSTETNVLPKTFSL